ncbi:hypothetical protein BDB00DRAFT_29862 [Zychaea mexicana]|uniref:uncharacterized protein n=1 Tax=Zychaea mexicana TaxID=64656 RepID=UPI0022FE1103|nr:uncharacterized protein BDB00DRAFT_29862 [Zychaea mexicana]KAI9488764.1 hypothetical protein BDB00DRAFT_29862 [Zychaea mexicana]
MPLYTPCKHIYPPNDPFFQEGNIALRAYWLERDAKSEREIALIRQEANSLAEDFTRLIYCEQKTCVELHKQPIAFFTTAAYEAHYETHHKHVCSACHKRFPSAHWLQLHLDEFHNVLIQIQKERGDKVFQCFVESCTKKFISPRMRQLHLVDKHQYPKYYPFDLVATGTLSFEERQRRHRPRRHHSPQQQNQQNNPDAMAVDKKEDNSDNKNDHNGLHDYGDDNHNEKKQHKPHRRPYKSSSSSSSQKQQQHHHKPKKAENPMDVDSKQKSQPRLQWQKQVQKEDQGNTSSLMMDIDQLTNKMSRLQIPRSVAFGRGGRRAFSTGQRVKSKQQEQ